MDLADSPPLPSFCPQHFPVVPQIDLSNLHRIRELAPDPDPSKGPDPAPDPVPNMIALA